MDNFNFQNGSIRIPQVYETVHRRIASTLIMVVSFLLISASCVGQVLTNSACPTTAIVNPNGTIALQAPNLTILNECHDVLNESFIGALYHCKCSGVIGEFVVMVTDQGKTYPFNLPYQNSSYYSQWCGSLDWNSYYQQNVKWKPNWQNPTYNIRCNFIRGNGHNCERFSEQDYCWQHR